MNWKELGIESYKIAERDDTISETWDWCIHLVSGVTFAGAGSSLSNALEKIEYFANYMKEGK